MRLLVLVLLLLQEQGRLDPDEARKTMRKRKSK
jgi:hypothetical protein